MRTVGPFSGIGEETGKIGDAGDTKTNLPILLCCLGHNLGLMRTLSVTSHWEFILTTSEWSEDGNSQLPDASCEQSSLLSNDLPSYHPCVSLASLCPSPCRYHRETERV